MAVVQPFRAIRYDAARWSGDLSTVICPPYDVLDEADRARLLARDGRNFVGIDLPYMPPKQAGPQEVYDRSAATLKAWLADGTLIQEAVPCLYAYYQTFTQEGRSYVRRMFFARLRLERFGEGSVFPHEETFGGPKEDRLKLTLATRCNLSPIFGMYDDPENAVAGALAAATSGQPTCQATLDGVENRLWAIRDRTVIDRVASLMADKKIYIADGHHRYGTGLMYRDEVVRREGALPAEHPANYVLTVCCGMNDPGCLILPTHRVLTETGLPDAAGLAKAWSEGCRACSADQADLTLFDGKTEIPVEFTRPEVPVALAADKSAAWRALDLAYLHRYLIDDLLVRARKVRPTIHYFKAEGAARELAGRGGIACLTRPISMAELRAVSDAGDLMPQKSTYFYPKLATGLVVCPLTG